MRRFVAVLLTVGLAFAFLALAWPPIGQAAYVTNNDNLPPLGGEYDMSGTVLYMNGVQIKDVVQHNYSSSWPPPAPGNNTLHTFGEQIDGKYSVDGGSTWYPYTAPATETDFVQWSSSQGSTQYYNTEMTQLDCSGGNLPMGVRIRESPILSSTGQTSITDDGGGMYHIDSFFDVFTELSLDDGNSWVPSSGSAHTTLVPEPSSFVLLAVGLLALAARRRWAK